MAVVVTSSSEAQEEESLMAPPPPPETEDSLLQLHDIIRSMSPSPSPHPQREKEESMDPEPLTEDDISSMRLRVEELDREELAMTEREKELLTLVRKLLASPRSHTHSQDQIHHQAETISFLSFQRDFIARQAELERMRWVAEREEWDRTAEALVRQCQQRGKVAAGAGGRDEELERYCASYESSNKALREKLHDTQTRLHLLESEVTKLRPILLMEPPPAAAFPYPNIGGGGQPTNVTKSKSKLKTNKKKQPKRAEDDDEEVLDDPLPPPIEPPTPSSLFHQFQAHNDDDTTTATRQEPQQTTTQTTTTKKFTGDHYRRPPPVVVGGPLTAPPTTLEFQVIVEEQQQQQRQQRKEKEKASAVVGEAGSSSRQQSKIKRQRQGLPPSTPLTSDARTEHLLLAARKIGRERVALLSARGRGGAGGKEQQQQLQQVPVERGGSVGDAEVGTSAATTYYHEGGGPSVVSTPHTPKRSSGGSGRHQSASGSVSPWVVDVMTGSPSRPQHRPRKEKKQSASATPQPLVPPPPSQGPSTPLASLLDAARMMHGDKDRKDGGSGSTSARMMTTRARSRRTAMGVVNGTITRSTRRRSSTATEVQDNPGSAPTPPPPAKRRRIAFSKATASTAVVKGGSSNKNEGVEDAEGLGRVRSALDVLADEAAAVFRGGKGRRDEDSGGTPRLISRPEPHELVDNVNGVHVDADVDADAEGDIDAEGEIDLEEDQS